LAIWLVPLFDVLRLHCLDILVLAMHNPNTPDYIRRPAVSQRRQACQCLPWLRSRFHGATRLAVLIALGPSLAPLATAAAGSLAGSRLSRSSLAAFELHHIVRAPGTWGPQCS
jgi:hypothetical protein